MEELAKVAKPTPAALLGKDAQSPYQRILALEDAVNTSIARQRSLEIENSVLRSQLDKAQAHVDRLLIGHQDSQRLLLQAVDDLRQMVKAGEGGSPCGVLDAETPKVSRSDGGGEGTYWKAKHDQLLTQFIGLDKKNRLMASQLHDLGIDAD